MFSFLHYLTILLLLFIASLAFYDVFFWKRVGKELRAFTKDGVMLGIFFILKASTFVLMFVVFILASFLFLKAI